MVARHHIRDKSLNKKENNSNENVDKFLEEINLSNLLTATSESSGFNNRNVRRILPRQ